MSWWFFHSHPLTPPPAPQHARTGIFENSKKGGETSTSTRAPSPPISHPRTHGRTHDSSRLQNLKRTEGLADPSVLGAKKGGPEPKPSPPCADAIQMYCNAVLFAVFSPASLNGNVPAFSFLANPWRNALSLVFMTASQTAIASMCGTSSASLSITSLIAGNAAAFSASVLGVNTPPVFSAISCNRSMIAASNATTITANLSLIVFIEHKLISFLSILSERDVRDFKACPSANEKQSQPAPSPATETHSQKGYPCPRRGALLTYVPPSFRLHFESSLVMKRKNSKMERG